MRSLKVICVLSFFIFNYSLSANAVSEQVRDQASAESSPASITIGVNLGGNPEAIKIESKFLAEQLQKKLNIPVNIYISKNYAGLSEALKNKKIDYAFLTSFSLVEAEKESPIKVLLKKTWAGPYYFASLVVRQNSSIKSVKDFKGKTIAFVDPQSTSGYLYPQVYIRKHNLNDKSFKNIIFSGSHAASIEKLENKEVDIAAVFSDDEKGKEGAWIRFRKSPKSKFRTLWTSDPIPNDPLVVRTEFYETYPKLTHDLMYQLIEMQNDLELRKKISEVLGKGDLMPATSKQYDPVREINKVFKK